MPSRAAPAFTTPSAKPSLTSDAAKLALGSLFTQVAQVITLAVLARAVAKDQIATYQQLNLVYSVAAPLLLAGVPTALLYFVPRAETPEERRAWITRAYFLLGAIGLVAAGTLVALRQPLADLFNNDELEHALVYYAPFLFFAFVAAVAPPTLITGGHARLAALLNAVIGAATLTCVVVAALVSPTGTGLALALSSAGALLATASVWLVRSTGIRLIWIGLRDGDMAKMAAYGLPLAATGLAGTLGYQFDRIVVGISFASDDFAVYALGAVEIPLGLLIATAVGNVLLPRLTVLWRDGDRAGMVAIWREATRKTSLVVLPLFVFLMVMSADVIRLLYGPGFTDSLDVFRIYLLLLPLRVATWGLIPQAIGRTRVNFHASLVILATNACVALALIGPLGLIGAALAAPVSAVLAVGYYLAWLHWKVPLSVRGLVPFGALVSTLLVAGIAAIPLLAIRELALPASVRLAVAGLVFVVLAPVALRATRRISDDDWRRLIGAVRHLPSPARRRT
jgi:O-antigen/teichoic acid export membrane protein